ncbi:MAG: 3-hydroxyacyl-CoA dehydrogenase NAD-binding domain-containing protein [Ferruginibacter sp.]
MIQSVSVVGAGTMGNGIALAAAIKNFPVILCDINAAVLEAAQKTIDQNLQTLVNKQKITPAEKETTQGNISFTTVITGCKTDLVIEAVVERMDVKLAIFQQLAAVNDAASILASNTSSLSINALQKEILQPERVAGLHFFNPAHIMKLVEVVQGEHTSADTAQQLMEFCKAIQKVPVLCKDAPGFIVNRVARHYYLEAMHLAAHNNIPVAQIDAAMEAAGFKMGPFRLMDMIGMDINLAVSRSLYEAFDEAPRFKPSPLQVEKVEKGELGRKTGKGFYEYNS